MRTIGVSVEIPSPHGEWLRERRAAFGDPLAESVPAHVTLLPPTEVSDEQFVAMRDHLRDVAAQRDSFAMVLRSAGTFRPVSPVVFVTVAQGIAECEQLENAVRSGPLDRPRAFTYHPHVTVAHHLPDDVLDEAFDSLAGYEARFRIEDFRLYELGADEVWRTVEVYALGV